MNLRFLLQANVFGVLFYLIFIPTIYAQTITPKVAVNYGNSYVLTESGEVYSFGHNEWGELGQGNLNRNDIFGPVDVSNLGGKKIWKIGEGVGGFHQLMIAEDSTLVGYGSNSNYQLGSSVSTDKKQFPVQLNPPALAGRKIVQAVQTDDDKSYVLTDSGYVFVAGANPNGHIGLGTLNSPITSFTRIDTTHFNGDKIVKIISGEDHRFFLSDSGNVYAAGRNFNGELGIGYSGNAEQSPVSIDQTNLNGKTIVDIAAGSRASILLTQGGAIFTSGYRGSGSLGLGDLSQDVHLFTEVTHSTISGKSMVQIGMVGSAAFMLSSDGMLYGMGSQLDRQNGAFISPNVPTKLLDSSALDGTLTGLVLGGFQDGSRRHIVLTTDTGKHYAFGYGERGETGTGYTTYLETPTLLNLSQVSGDSVTQIVGQYNVTFLLDNEGTAYSTGGDNILYNTGDLIQNTLGRSIIQGAVTPKKMNLSNITGKTIVDVVPGTKHAFLLTDDGEVYATGRGAGGQLGTGDSIDVYIPVRINHSNIAGKKIIKIASGGTDDDENPQGHTLLLAEDGTVFSFGNNEYGQLGLGDRDSRLIPTQITDAGIASKKIVDIDANGRNSLFIADDGTVWLSGFGGNGEMGFGDTDDRLIPTHQNHANLSGVSIAEGVLGTSSSSTTHINVHIVLRSSDNRLFSFGEGSDGQLAQGVKSDNYVPTEISASSYDNKTPAAIEAGYRTIMVRMVDGSLYAAGNALKIGFDTSFFTDYVTLTRVEGGLKDRFVTDMATFVEFSMAVLDDGTVLTFGSFSGEAYYGNYGNGEPSTAQKIPAEVNDFNVLSSPIPTTNLALHLDAGRGLTQSGDTVSVWANLADTLDASESTAEVRPLVADSIINHHRAILFDGVDHSLTLPTASNLGMASSDYEIFLVAKSATVNSTIQFVMAGSSEQYELQLNGTSGARFIPKIGAYIDQGGNGAYTDTTAHLFNMGASSTTGFISVNKAVSQVTGDHRSSYTGDLLLGRGAATTSRFNGYIAELIIYNETLSDADRGRVEDYLVKKYAITNNIDANATLTGTEGWRLLASPVADSSYAPLLSNLWTQGFTGAKSPDFGTPNVFTWDTNSTDGDASNWTPLGDISNTFTPGTGALVYVFSDDNYDEPGDAGFPKTLPVTGIEPLGEQNLTSQLNASENGWTLLGNPFRYDIRWDAFSKNSLSNAVYVYDNNTAGWKSWNGTTGGLTGGKIGAFNGFFVQTMGSEPEIIIPDSSKTYETGEFLGKERADNPVYTLSLQAKHEDGLANTSWFQLSGDGLLGIDAFDAHKLTPLSDKYVSLGSVLNDTTILDINSLPLNGDPVEIPLQLTTSESGAFTITRENMNIPEDWEIELIDTQTGESTNLESEYRFTVNQTAAKTTPKDLLTTRFPMKSASAEKAEPRFRLKVIPGITTGIEEPNLPKEVNLSQNYPNPFNPSTVISYQLPESGKVELKVFDMLGREVALLVNERMTAGYHKVTFDAGNLASGMYIYRLKTGNTVITKKLTLIK